MDNNLNEACMTGNVQVLNELVQLSPSQNVTNPKSKPKGLMSRAWSWYLNNNGNWLEKQRGILMLATIFVATSSFYSGLHPPGGTFTDSRDGPLGNAVQDNDSFLIENTIILVLSLMIFVILLSGISLKNKFCLWVLNLATVFIIFMVTFTYLTVIANMSPDSWVNATTVYMCLIWMLLCLLFAFIHTIFFITWVVKKTLKPRTRTRNSDPVCVV